MSEFEIGNRRLGDGQPVYFIADIAANHDGRPDRAVELIRLAAASGEYRLHPVDDTGQKRRENHGADRSCK